MTATFDLLETLRWVPGQGFFLLGRHLSRIEESARHFGYRCEIDHLRGALEDAVRTRSTPQRVRLLLARDGEVRVETAALTPPATARVVLAKAPIDAADEFLRHKTTHRQVYEEARRTAAFSGVDDVMLWNPALQITESTIANIVVELGGRKLTPSVECGLLAGTFRAQLLEDGVIEEAIVTVDQLGAAAHLWLINSVREWWPAQLEAHRAAATPSTPISSSAPIPGNTNRSQR
jgi:para-aminobenzoate synthetase/4-amino-4-deoxychorismate lyase